MTTYKEIFGKQIKQLSSDPTDSEAEGQVWYNTTAGVFKTVLSVAAWSAGGNYPGAQSYLAGMGTLTAGLAAGGDTPGVSNVSAEYNGSSWTAGNNINTARRNLAQAGGSPQTAGIVFGGADPPAPATSAATEEYDGTNWSTVTAMPLARSGAGGLGVQTAALAIGSNTGPLDGTTTSEYDGTNWTAGGALSQARNNAIGVGAGTQTAGLAVGGGPNPAVVGKVEEYNGSSWTTGGALPAVKEKLGTTGIQTLALSSGGSSYPASPPVLATSFIYDGTSWAATASLGTGRYAQGTGGNATSGFIIGGLSLPSNTAATEEFGYASITKTLTSS